MERSSTRRIAHVISTPEGSGGAEQILASLVQRGRERGCEQLVLNPMASQDLSGDLRALCAGTRYEGFSRTGIRGTLAVRQWLAARLEDFAPEIVHVHLAHASVLVASLPKREGRTLVLTHHHGDHFQATRGKKLVDRLAGRRFDQVVAISNFVAEYLLNEYGYEDKKVVRIPNGWSGTPISRSRSSVATVVCVANFRPEKNHAMLLRAFRLVWEALGSSQAAARLKLAGAGQLRPALTRQVTELGLDHMVEFLGPVDDIWPLLGSSDVFALPSAHEAFGLVVLEAMAARVPVVATRVGALPELITSEHNGLLVDRDDHVQMAQAMLRLLSDPTLSMRICDSAIATAAEYRIETMLDRYFALYSRLAERPNTDLGNHEPKETP